MIFCVFVVVAVCYYYGVITYCFSLLLGVGVGGTIGSSINLTLLLKIITEPNPAELNADYNCPEEYN
jgi:hypothetical protein